MIYSLLETSQRETERGRTVCVLPFLNSHTAKSARERITQLSQPARGRGYRDPESPRPRLADSGYNRDLVGETCVCARVHMLAGLKITTIRSSKYRNTHGHALYVSYIPGTSAEREVTGC